jgi:hypothetical protein
VLVSLFTTKSTEDTEAGREEGVRTGQEPTLCSYDDVVLARYRTYCAGSGWTPHPY